MQCSVVQRSLMYYDVKVYYSVVQCSVVQCSVVQRKLMYYHVKVYYSVVQRSVVQCNVVWCSVVYYSIVQCIIVQCSVDRVIILFIAKKPKTAPTHTHVLTQYIIQINTGLTLSPPLLTDQKRRKNHMSISSISANRDKGKLRTCQ